MQTAVVQQRLTLPTFSSGQTSGVTMVAAADYSCSFDKIRPTDHGTRTLDGHAHS
jgi:hypothetical protein